MKIPSCSVLVLIILLALCPQVYAQEENNPKPAQLTTSFLGSIGVAVFSGTEPKGSENSSLSPAFSFGVLGEIPFSEEFAIIAAATIDGRSMAFSAKEDENISQHVTGFYFSLAVGIEWEWLFFTPVMGLPFLGYQSMNPDPYLLTTEQSPDPIGQMSSATVDADEFDMLLDLRLGALIPLSKDPEESWKLLVSASIPVSNFVKEYTIVSSEPTLTFGQLTDSKLFTFLAGINYRF